ncbi:hypothetical protein BGX26_012974 [Mortierella sp. AD094]|nr:hypothetical protein BGX26_012974 [Mortierella sp. AD094]
MEVHAATLSIMPSTSTSSVSTSSAVPTSLSPVHTATPSQSDVQSWSTSTTPAVTPENDPNPSWTFYPPSATYIPPTTCSTSTTATSPTSPKSPLPTSPSRSPRSSPPPASSDTPNSQNNLIGGSSSASSTPSTHHRILDHCFHLSIETRLKQAEAQYLASIQEQAVEQQQINGWGQGQSHDCDQGSNMGHEPLEQGDWQKRQRSLVDEAVVLGRKGSNVEAIVEGILKSHRSSGPLQTLPRHLKHRLHLCQLTSMVFGRFDIASATNNTGLNIYSAFHSRRHGTSRAAIKHQFSHSEQGKLLQTLLMQPISASQYCRRHHRRDCKRTCCTLAKLQQEQQQALELKKKIANNYYMNNVRKPEQSHQRITGLVDAIPAFLKCSAMSYRDIAKGMVDKGELENIKDMKVQEGWYKLLLEMMTQAAIESYLCDEDTGFDTILDVFSFGDDPDSETTVLKDIAIEDSSAISSQLPSTPPPSAVTGVEGLQFQSLNGLGSTTMPIPLKDHLTSLSPMLQDVTTQDRQDDILFAKTPQYVAFKAAKDERLQEFLSLKGKSKEQHFADLANKYPLIVFERQMTHFIARSQKLLVDPKLSSQNLEPMRLLIPPTTSAYADGSLSMPVSEDEDEDAEMEANRVQLEEIKEEDENETIDEQQRKRHQQQFPTPPASIVVVSRNDNNDDDNSTAARVVQMPKKHKHHHEITIQKGEVVDADNAGHAAKKAKYL